MKNSYLSYGIKVFLTVGTLFLAVDRALSQSVTTYTSRTAYNAAIPGTANSTFEDFSSIVTNTLMSTSSPGDDFDGFFVSRTGTGQFGTSGFCPSLDDPQSSTPTACVGYNVNAPSVPGIVGSYDAGATVTFTADDNVFAFGFDTIDWNDGSQRSSFVLHLSDGSTLPVTGPTNSSSPPPAFFGFILDATSVSAGVRIDRIVWSPVSGAAELVGYWDIVASTLPPPELEVTANATTTANGQNATIMDAGDIVSFSVTLDNDSHGSIGPITFSTSVSGASISCPPGGSNTVTSVPAESSVTCTVSYTLTQSDFDTNGGGDGAIEELASASYTAGSNNVLLTDDAQASLTTIPDLDVQKVADDTTNVIAGQEVTYTYTITNSGNLTISNIRLSDAHNASGPQVVPTGETLATPGGTAVSSTTNDTTSNNVWDALGPGDAIEFTGTYTVTQNDIETLQ